MNAGEDRLALHPEETSMDLNRLAGATSNAAGEMRNAAAGLTVDVKRPTEDVGRLGSEAARDAYGQIDERTREAAAILADSLRRKPFAALLIECIVGSFSYQLLARR
jgi:hypothetical protein